jgi:hypothetical protein
MAAYVVAALRLFAGSAADADDVASPEELDGICTSTVEDTTYPAGIARATKTAPTAASSMQASAIHACCLILGR